MARPARKGLDYFPMDVGFLRDKKVRLIMAEFGASSVLFVLYVLCKVYEGDGYFLKWDKDEALIAADELRESPQYISEVLQGCLSRSLFDERVFQMFGVLTSAGIQRRYLRSCEKRDEIEICDEYWLLDIDDKKDVPTGIRAKLAFFEFSGVKNPVNSPGNPVNSPGNPKSKVKESKVKESKVDLTVSKETVCRTKDVRRVIEAWNSLGLQTIKQILPDTDRGKMLRKRVNDYGIDDVLAAIEKVRFSSFLMGDNKNGWQATFDWFIRPNNFPKVLSGNYDNKKAKSKSSNVFMDLLESGELNDEF